MKDWMIVTGLGVLVAAIVVGTILLVNQQLNWEDEQQHKQDKCLAAGGMWIDNRHTDGYCFFNK